MPIPELIARPIHSSADHFQLFQFTRVSSFQKRLRLSIPILARTIHYVRAKTIHSRTIHSYTGQDLLFLHWPEPFIVTQAGPFIPTQARTIHCDTGQDHSLWHRPGPFIPAQASTVHSLTAQDRSFLLLPGLLIPTQAIGPFIPAQASINSSPG